MKVVMTVELVMDNNYYPMSDEEKMMYENEIFVGDGSLLMRSNEIGDVVGVVKSVTNIKFYDNI